MRRLQRLKAGACAFLAAAGLALGIAAEAPAQTPFRPVATVNKSLITAYDVDQRARIIAAFTGGEITGQQLANQALDQLIEDRLKTQAATDVGLEVTPEIVDRGVAEFAQRFQTSPEDFRGRLAGLGVSDQAIADLVGGQMLWREVVRQRFLGRIEPGEAEIDAEIALSGAGQDQRFRFSEIGLPFADGGRGEAETRALADRLFSELSAGGDFEAAVRTHSRAPSAERGGDVGWVDAADIPEGLRRTVASRPDGTVLPPQEVPGGLSILRIVAREGGGAGNPDDPEIRERVRREILNRRLDLFAQGLIQELRRDAMIQLR